jgi:hypothetical protein
MSRLSYKAKKRSLLSYIGLAPTPEEMEMVNAINNTYESMKVVGRGTVTVSVEEVINNPEFKDLYPLAKDIVRNAKYNRS